MGNSLKDNLQARLVTLSGETGGGIYMESPTTGAITTIVDENGNIDAPVTSTNLTLSGTLDVDGVATFGDDVNIAGNLTVDGTSIVNGVVADPVTFEDTATFEAVATFEVAPVMEAGQEIGGPIYTTGSTGAVATSPENVQDVVTASGAIDQTAYNHLIDTDSGALALTLGAPTSPRQRLRFQMVVDGGGGTNDATLTFNGTATLVFTGVGDYAELQHNGAEWVPLVNVNLVSGAIVAYTPA